MSISTPATSAPHELDLTIISGKHLKNVNWKNGDLKPYAIFWVDPDNKLTTKSDDSGNTKPVWNQRFILPINSPLSDTSFSLEIFHSKSSEAPKPFVGSLHVPLSDLPDPTNGSLIRTFNLHRPSGRPQGKIQLKLSLKEHPLQQNYQNVPVNPYYYSSAPPYPLSSAPRSTPATAYPYSTGYYSGGWPTQPRSYCAPSAPVEFGQSQTSVVGGGIGPGLGFAAGAMAGAVGGMALDEGLRREEGNMGERVEESSRVQDDFSDYRGEY